MRQSVQRVVPHERDRVFDLVADVEAYPSFLPLWKTARIIDRTADGYRTRQSLGIGPATLDFTSTTAVTPPDRIVVTARDGPMRDLRMVWTFEEVGPGQCRVSLDLVVEVRSRILQKLLQATYGEMAPRLVSNFEARARAVARGEVEPPPSGAPAGGAASPSTAPSVTDNRRRLSEGKR